MSRMRSSRLTLIGIGAFAVVIFSLLAGNAHARTVAIVPFGDIARQLEAPFRSSFEKIEGVRVMPPATAMKELEAAQQTGLTCTAQHDDCLVKLALLLRVDQLVTIDASVVGPAVNAQLVVIDAAAGRRAGSVALQLAQEESVDTFDDAAIRLLAPTATMGTLVFDVRPAGAHIRVDNGAAMTAPQIRLRAGKHTVEVSAEGFETETGTVEVRPAMTTTFRATLVPAPTVEMKPPGAKETAGVGSGLSVAGAAVTSAGAIGLVGSGIAAFILDGILHTPQGTASQREQMLFWEQVSAGIGVASGAVLLAGSIMLIVAD